MTDIVERLRGVVGDLPPDGHPRLAAEAAVEIERLRAALQEIAAYPHREEGGEIARRALEPKP